MRRMLALTVLVTAPTFASAAVERHDVPERCKEIRLLRDGRQVVGDGTMRSRGSPDNRAESGSGPYGSWGSASAHSRSGSAHSAMSSVSSSSSSSSSSTGGRGTSRSVSSYTDEDGRTVTTTHDERGCTIVVDERETRGE